MFSILPVEQPIGDPSLSVNCRPDGLFISSETRELFDGKVYVKDFAFDENCVRFGDGKIKNVIN